MNEKKVTDIFNNVNIILWTYDISSGKMTISGDLMNFCGFSSEEITKEPGNWTKYIHPEDFKILNEIYKNIILNEITVKELRIIRPNGQIMCLHVKVIPILDHSGIITRIDGITIDTTEKKSEALQSKIPLSNKSNNKLNLLINRDGIITNVSNFNETNADEVSNHLLNKSIFSFFSGEQLQKIKKDFAEVKTGRGQTFKTVMKTEHSIVYQLDIKVLTVKDEENNPTILCLIEYQNLLFETKRYVRNKERAIRQLVSNRGIGVWHYNLEANILITSKGIERISGYSTKDFLNDQFLWRKIIHPEDLEKFNDAENKELSRLITQRQYRIITKDCQEKWVKDQVISTVNEEGTVAFIEGLLTAPSFSQRIKPIKLEGNSYKTGKSIIDLNGKFISLNKTALEMSGYSEDELLSMTCFDLIPNEEKERVRNLITNIIYGEEIQGHLINVIHKDGHTIQLNLFGVPLYNGEDISRIHLIANDLSYKFQLDKTLMKTKQNFYQIYNNIELAIFLSTPEEKGLGTILEVNQYACKMLGYQYNELVNMPFKKIIHMNHSGVKSIFDQEYFYFRTFLVTRDGQKIPIFLFSHLTNWEEKRVILTIAKQKDILLEEGGGSNDSGQRLRILMAEMNINTNELAFLTNLTTATISNIRTGKVKKPNLETARKIAGALGVNINTLWPDANY